VQAKGSRIAALRLAMGRGTIVIKAPQPVQDWRECGNIRTDNRERSKMNTIKYIYWQDENMWLGYLEEYPDYWAQGETIEELQEHLKDIFKELTGGNIPCVRRVAELELA
jgi:predicted RNase H-like HicB family nuclease